MTDMDIPTITLMQPRMAPQITLELDLHRIYRLDDPLTLPPLTGDTSRTIYVVDENGDGPTVTVILSDEGSVELIPRA